MQNPEAYIKRMLREATDEGAYKYDPTVKNKQVWKWEKMEQQAQSQCGSNSATYFLYRRAKFIEKDREERMQNEENEKKRVIEVKQKLEANKAEMEKKLNKNRLKRQKKKERKEKYEKKQRGEIVEAPAKKIVRNEAAMKAVADSLQKKREALSGLADLSDSDNTEAQS